MRSEIQRIIDRYPETAYIHGRLNAVRLCHLMETLYDFFRAKPHLVPKQFRAEFKRSQVHGTWLIVAAMRAQGRLMQDGQYQDFGRGITFCKQGKLRCQSHLTTLGLDPDKANNLASAIEACESDGPALTLIAWLLKHATILETLRDTRVKTIDTNMLPCWPLATNRSDQESIITLCLDHYRLIKQHQGFACVTLTADGDNVYTPNPKTESTQRKQQLGIERIKLLGNKSNSYLNTASTAEIKPVNSRNQHAVDQACNAIMNAESKAATNAIQQATEHLGMACEDKPLHSTLTIKELQQAYGDESKRYFNETADITYLTECKDKAIIPAFASDILLQKEGFISFYSAQRMWSGALQMTLTAISKMTNNSEHAALTVRALDKIGGYQNMRLALDAGNKLGNHSDTYCSDIVIAASVCPFDTKGGEGYLWALAENRSYHERTHLHDAKQIFAQELQKFTAWPEEKVTQFTESIFKLMRDHNLPNSYLQMFYVPENDDISQYVTLCTEFGGKSQRDSEEPTTLSNNLKQQRIGDQVRINVSHPHVSSRRFFTQTDQEHVNAFKQSLHTLLAGYQEHIIGTTMLHGGVGNSTGIKQWLMSVPIEFLAANYSIWSNADLETVHEALSPRFNDELIHCQSACAALIQYLHNNNAPLGELIALAIHGEKHHLAASLCQQPCGLSADQFHDCFYIAINEPLAPSTAEAILQQSLNYERCDYAYHYLDSEHAALTPKIAHQLTQNMRSYDGITFTKLHSLAVADTSKLNQEDLEAICLEMLNLNTTSEALNQHASMLDSINSTRIAQFLFIKLDELTIENKKKLINWLAEVGLNSADAFDQIIPELRDAIITHVLENALHAPNAILNLIQQFEYLSTQQISQITNNIQQNTEANELAKKLIDSAREGDNINIWQPALLRIIPLITEVPILCSLITLSDNNNHLKQALWLRIAQVMQPDTDTYAEDMLHFIMNQPDFVRAPISLVNTVWSKIPEQLISIALIKANLHQMMILSQENAQKLVRVAISNDAFDLELFKKLIDYARLSSLEESIAAVVNAAADHLSDGDLIAANEYLYEINASVAHNLVITKALLKKEFFVPFHHLLQSAPGDESLHSALIQFLKSDSAAVIKYHTDALESIIHYLLPALSGDNWMSAACSLMRHVHDEAILNELAFQAIKQPHIGTDLLKHIAQKRHSIRLHTLYALVTSNAIQDAPVNTSLIDLWREVLEKLFSDQLTVEVPIKKFARVFRTLTEREQYLFCSWYVCQPQFFTDLNSRLASDNDHMQQFKQKILSHIAQSFSRLDRNRIKMLTLHLSFRDFLTIFNNTSNCMQNDFCDWFTRQAEFIGFFKENLQHNTPDNHILRTKLLLASTNNFNLLSEQSQLYLAAKTNLAVPTNHFANLFRNQQRSATWVESVAHNCPIFREHTWLQNLAQQHFDRATLRRQCLSGKSYILTQLVTVLRRNPEQIKQDLGGVLASILADPSITARLEARNRLNLSSQILKLAQYTLVDDFIVTPAVLSWLKNNDITPPLSFRIRNLTSQMIDLVKATRHPLREAMAAALTQLSAAANNTPLYRAQQLFIDVLRLLHQRSKHGTGQRYLPCDSSKIRQLKLDENFIALTQDAHSDVVHYADVNWSSWWHRNQYSNVPSSKLSRERIMHSIHRT